MEFKYLKEIINDIDKLITHDFYKEIPKEYWHEYLYCTALYDKKQRYAELQYCVLPYVPIVCKGEKGIYIGHGLYEDTSGKCNYKYCYFLTEDGGLTRDINQAKVIWLFPKSTSNSDLLDVILKRPSDFFIIDLQLLWEAQNILDNNYPLPRKAISKKVRQQVYEKFNGHCAYCGEKIELNEMQVDHITSHKGNGGKDTIENYNPACELCNRVKSNLTLEEFKEDIRHRGFIHRNRKTPINADSDRIAKAYSLEEKDQEITFYFENKE